MGLDNSIFLNSANFLIGAQGGGANNFSLQKWSSGEILTFLDLKFRPKIFLLLPKNKQFYKISELRQIQKLGLLWATEEKFRSKKVRILPLKHWNRKKNLGPSLDTPYLKMIDLRKSELSNPKPNPNQKSFKIPWFYTKIHHLSNVQKNFELLLTPIYIDTGKLRAKSFCLLLQNMSVSDFLSLLGAHQMWSI